MKPKERIRNILKSKKSDPIGNYAFTSEDSLREWQYQGYHPNAISKEYLNSILRPFHLNDPDLEQKFRSSNDEDKFLVLSFSGPFEAISERKGKLNVLKEIAANPEKIAKELSSEACRIMDSIRTLTKKGIIFDGAWIWSDLAYKGSLFFSKTFYEKYLFQVHKELISFLKSCKLPVIFHSDGKIDQIIPYLLDAGVAALYPLDKYAGMDIPELTERYNGELVFFDSLAANV